MTREAIAWEGYDTGDGRIILQGALRWEEPIVARNLDGSILGKYVNVQREENGSITAEFVPMGSAYAPAIDISDVTWLASDDRTDTTVLNARLRGVSMVPRDSAPWKDLR